jgi:hypothetical protein
MTVSKGQDERVAAPLTANECYRPNSAGHECRLPGKTKISSGCANEEPGTSGRALYESPCITP